MNTRSSLFLLTILVFALSGCGTIQVGINNPDQPGSTATETVYTPAPDVSSPIAPTPTAYAQNDGPEDALLATDSGADTSAADPYKLSESTPIQFAPGATSAQFADQLLAPGEAHQNGKPYNIATEPIGDRTVTKAIAIQSGEVTMDVIVHGPNDAACCPSTPATWKFKLDGDKLVWLSKS